MKCGTCRTTEANVLKKINEDDDLFEILKSLNEKRAYNPKYKYFCEECIGLATAKLSHLLTTISNQTVTVTSASTGSNESNESKDEYDEIVSAKRVFSNKGTPLLIPESRTKRPSANEPIQSKPCPKRFKKPLAPIQLKSISEGSSSGQQKSKPNVSSKDGSSGPQSSEGLSAEDLMVAFSQNSSSVDEQLIASLRQDSSSNSSIEEQPIARPTAGRLRRGTTPSSNNSIEEQPIASHIAGRLQRGTTPSSNNSIEEQPIASPTTGRLRHSKDSLSSEGRANKGGMASDRTSSSQNTSRNKPAASPRRANKTPSNRQRSSDRSNTANDATSGTLAPAVKTPRIRQPIGDMTRNLHNYFSTANFDVNNYSRTLAG